MPEEIKIPEPVTEMSFSDIFVGILSSPGEIYQSIVGTEPKTSHWAIPLTLVLLVGIIFTLVVFTQPAIQDEMSAAQLKTMQQRVADGRMTQAEMERATEMNPAKPGSPMFLIFGSIGVVVVIAFSLFAYSGVYFAAGKIFFKSTISYSKVMEVYGLSMYVGVVVSLLTMVIVVAMGSIYASLSPTLFIEEFDPTDKTHKLMAALNLLEFWTLYVVGVGLSKVWSVSILSSLGVVGGTWAVWTLLKVFVDFGF